MSTYLGTCVVEVVVNVVRVAAVEGSAKLTSSVAHGRTIIMNGSARNLSVLRMAFLIVGMVARTEAGNVLQECVVLCSSEWRVKAVMADLESKTCLRFMARSEEKPYLLVNVGRGNCWTSSIGYPREKVTINLGLGCRHRARITHELLHALGFLHEHSRPDRDHYVAVNWDNIMKGTKRNFVISRKYSTLEVPYDYGSIMHYGDYAYAVNRSQPTLVRKQGGPGRMGGTHLTHLDILRINTFYRCHLSPPPSS
ncbi:low choriolytic enzyme-like isoform X1 [Procambarus clarkii]|uniref:low choriolytic enzyme-like isoform X1 n=2 Tax=Procambarus clarkii TaxID=6728 RepID=UPI0037426375